jgi:AhpD family alkylhydroperoxidase
MEHTTIFVEIVKERQFDELPPFYRAMIPYPKVAEQLWDSLKRTMAPGAIDPKTKEMIALSISVALGARYAIDSHVQIARNLGMTDDEFDEILMLAGAFAHTASLCSALNPLYVALDAT